MSARFQSGDWVRVKSLFPPGHVRTPFYCRGKSGVVERFCGAYRMPERLAYGQYDAPQAPLYRVRFAQHEMWPDYAGGARDHIEIEIYEHWLEADDHD